MKGAIFLLAIAGVVNAQVVPPAGSGDLLCDSVITDPCGGSGQPACCYSKYTTSGSCLDGKLVIGNLGHGPCDAFQDEQRKAGCSCPPGCTTGDIDGAGQCV